MNSGLSTANVKKAASGGRGRVAKLMLEAEIIMMIEPNGKAAAGPGAGSWLSKRKPGDEVVNGVA